MSLTPGAGFRRGSFLVASSTRARFPYRPRLPGRSRRSLRRDEGEVGDGGDRRRTAARAAGVGARCRQGRAGGLYPGAGRDQRAAAGAGGAQLGTTKREILSLADWLRGHRVATVVMEATSNYWKATMLPQMGATTSLSPSTCRTWRLCRRPWLPLRLKTRPKSSVTASSSR
jgi:hypothetical protein